MQGHCVVWKIRSLVWEQWGLPCVSSVVCGSGSPLQVYWYASGCTYWVHWHMVEIIGFSGQEEHEGREKVSTVRYSHKLAAGEHQARWARSFFPGPCLREQFGTTGSYRHPLLAPKDSEKTTVPTCPIPGLCSQPVLCLLLPSYHLPLPHWVGVGVVITGSCCGSEGCATEDGSAQGSWWG